MKRDHSDNGTIHADDQAGVLYCSCGNDGGGLGSGFHTVARDGTPVEPTPKDWPEPLYCCDDCGNIVLWDTTWVKNGVRTLKLELVGKDKT